jgi:RNA polymerase-binding transcription factor DksA
MATKKPVKAAKPAAKASKSTTKAAPAPAKKPAVAAKPAAKKAAPAAKTATPAAKKAAAAPAKKAAPAKIAPKKVAAAKPAPKPVAKAEVKKPAAEPKATAKPAKPAAKAKTAVKKAPPKPSIPAPVQRIELRRPIVAPKTRPQPVKKAEPSKPVKVVIPKIATDKKVAYEPEFTKSVLDAAPIEHQGPTMRYSDAELNEFKDLIQKKLDAAKKELAYLQGLITRKDEMGGDESDNRYMTMEDGGMSMEREQLSQMASRQISFIDHLEKALMRIENKTYGICRVTGKLIDKARLRAVPHATLSMEAKLGIVK